MKEKIPSPPRGEGQGEGVCGESTALENRTAHPDHPSPPPSPRSAGRGGNFESGSNPFGYSPIIWDLFQRTPRAGRWPEDRQIVAAETGTPAGAARLRVQARLRDGHVEDARFQALGCPTTIAVGAWLAEWAVGKSATEIGRMDAQALRAALEIPDDRAHCAVMGEDLMQNLARAMRGEHGGAGD